jgi:hypothetical protein
VCSLSAILPNTKLERKQQDYGIVRGEIPTIWMTPVNNISTADRLRHFNEFTQLLTHLKISNTNGGDNNIDVVLEELELCK